MKRRPSLRPTRRLLMWLWRHRVRRYFQPPLCLLCRRDATVRLGKHAWICTRHPLLVSSTQYGIRPRWSPFTLTRKGQLAMFDGCGGGLLQTTAVQTAEHARAVGHHFLDSRKARERTPEW